MRELDTLIINAQHNRMLQEKLIRQHENYILKCASKVCHRYITKSDDEWSIALFAFSQAIESYNLEKGSFFKFAELVIKRRLIDYSKSQGKYSSEVSIDPFLFDTPPEEEEENLQIRNAVAEQVARQSTNDLKLEIETASKLFSIYGFTFFELSKCSPRSVKTKKACAKAVGYILQNPLLISEIRSTKQLPIKIIENNTAVPRKLIDRHRKYIIAAIEILNGDFPNLGEYLRYMKEEGLT